MGGRRATLAWSLALGITGCAGQTVPTPVAVTVVRAEATRNGIGLSAMAESVTVASGEVIEVTATLERFGPDPQELTGSGSGLVGFSVTRLEDGLTSGPPGTRLDCMSYLLSPDQPMVVQFSKSGGFSPDDPNADFMESYFAAPDLVLPSGTWRIDVTTLGNLGGECGGDQLIDLAVALVVFVTPVDP